MNIILCVRGKSHTILHHNREGILICYTSTIYKFKFLTYYEKYSCDDICMIIL